MAEHQLQQAQFNLLRPAIARLRASVMATVFGLLAGTGLLVATLWLVIQGGEDVGAHLGLLRNFYPGYSVTWAGAFVGMFYGMLTGGVLGYVVTYLYNLFALGKELR